MLTKLQFAVSYQGETEYKVIGGAFNGRTVRVFYANRNYYLNLAKFMRTPLERNMMERNAALAGTASFIEGDELPDEILQAARSRQRNAIRLCPDIAAKDLRAAILDSKGAWSVSESKTGAISTTRTTASTSAHPMFVAARKAAVERRAAMES